MSQFHGRFLTAGKSMVDVTGWGLPEIISEVTPTSFNKMDSDYYILFEERNPAQKNPEQIYVFYEFGILHDCDKTLSSADPPTSAELLVLSASCGGMLDLSASCWVIVPLCASRSLLTGELLQDFVLVTFLLLVPILSCEEWENECQAP